MGTIRTGRWGDLDVEGRSSAARDAIRGRLAAEVAPWDASRRAAAGRLATALALVALCAVLLATPARDVPLVYDSLGYAAQGASLAQGHGNTVSVGGRHHPGQYPVGVPLLTAVPIGITGDLQAGIWSIFACAVLCVLVTAGAARRFSGAPAGVLAALLLLSSGAFRSCATNIFSQVPTALAVVATAWLFVTARGPGRLAGAGALAVLSVLLRNANVGFPVALVAAACLVGPCARRRRLLAVVAGMAPAGLVVLAHNALLYGGPLDTGYHAWGWSADEQVSWAHVFGGGGTDERVSVVRSVAGLGRLYSVPLLAAVLYGGARAWRRRREDAPAARWAALTGAAVVAQLGVHLPQAFFAEIYLVPTVPLLAATAAVGVLGGRDPLRAVDARAAPALLVAVTLLVVSLDGDLPGTEPEQLAVARYASVRALAGVAEDDAVLLTTAAPALVEPVFAPEGDAGRRQVLYLEVYATGPLEDLGRRQFGASGPTPERVVERATELLAAGRPAYYSLRAPARGLEARHRAIHAALRRRFELRPTCLDDVRRLELRGDVE